MIRLPRISNFTDFNPFEMIPGVSLRYVSHVSELKHPDLIFLPGTKNTMEDLLWMRSSGMEAAVKKAAAAGTVIFGICGGYQMLGETLSDPDGVEAGGTIPGMGLLPMETVFTKQKTRTRVDGTFCQTGGKLSGLSGMPLEGYEIHMGQTVRKDGLPALTEICDTVASACKADGAWNDQVYGSYVHGIFDREEAAKALVMSLGAAKGVDMSEAGAVDFRAFKETQYDILADALREHLDMDKIYRILEEGAEVQ